ncbi:hypothetical protein BDQ12DRAFT_668695 [Crucibulum laeve]|uniref:Uncharacterized protein n=1 Tax=Crucibulum laeve TaxID=68775 RepID=A0A5C3LTV4_9AGAR|nr:hypothetical protein BDQ12DRAFT_668695 [Crucibulum laeve]
MCSSWCSMLRVSAFLSLGLSTVVTMLNQQARPGCPVLPHFWLLWVENEYPYLPLVPVHQPFYGPLFSRLSFNKQDVPVKLLKKDNLKAYTLEQSLKTELISLEQNLHALLHAIYDLIPLVTKEFQFWPFPKQFGYERLYTSERAVHITSCHSQDAFVPLMATITLGILVLNDREETFPDVTWQYKLLNQTGIHPQWLEAIEESAVSNLMVP